MKGRRDDEAVCHLEVGDHADAEGGQEPDHQRGAVHVHHPPPACVAVELLDLFVANVEHDADCKEQSRKVILPRTILCLCFQMQRQIHMIKMHANTL